MGNCQTSTVYTTTNNIQSTFSTQSLTNEKLDGSTTKSVLSTTVAKDLNPLTTASTRVFTKLVNLAFFLFFFSIIFIILVIFLFLNI